MKLPQHPATDPNPFLGVQCPACLETSLTLEWRDTLSARPLGTWSLAGAMPKTSASMVPWPWAVCASDDCDFAKAGKTDRETA
jgi:hypothetical protein